MKTVGLLGGMSWESTVDYYRLINRGVKASLGGLHSAKIVLYSIDFEPMEKQQHAGDWRGAAETLVDAAQQVEGAGADFLLICTNTMHKVADDVANAINIPLIHIADATGQLLVNDGVQKIGLLGTAFTMQDAFYKERIVQKYGIEVLVPDSGDQKIIHDIIYQELCQGKINEQSRSAYIEIIDRLCQKGAQGVILGCTEIGMLVRQTDTGVKLYDTTVIHAEKAVELAI